MMRIFHTLVVAVCCGIASVAWGDAGGLPDDPSKWVCQGTDTPVTPEQISAWCRAHPDRGRPARFATKPATLSDLNAKNAYDEELRSFLRAKTYRALGWHHDKRWRLTGPYVGDLGEGLSYGVHPLVRIYYSPEMVDWLCDGRSGDISDGAMIVKEMHGIDAASVEVDNGCMQAADTATDPGIEPSSWTVMVRDSSASADGWYWPNPTGSGDGNPPILDRSAVTGDDFFAGLPKRNPAWYPTGDLFGAPIDGTPKLADVVYPYTLFGAYCVNCHASAEKFLTYSSMDNIIEDGIRYKRFPKAAAEMLALRQGVSGSQHDEEPIFAAIADAGYRSPFPPPLDAPSRAFVDYFGDLGPTSFGDAITLRFPAETFDHRLSDASGAPSFVTSDQCIGCHDASSSTDAIPNMQIPDPGTQAWTNVSPYGEWRGSPMGLAGRDPIFFSQLQSETNHLTQLTACIENTCLHCHGVMGQRQFAMDTEDGKGECKNLFGVEPPPDVPFGKPFRRAMVARWQDANGGETAKYGNLARDGISCTVCHHISDKAGGEESGFTGNFVTGPADEIYGPYKEVVVKPMEHALAVTPKFAGQMATSELCGSCHAILLPVLTNDGKPMGFSYEQTTYLEWTNSVFARGDTYRSCQDCHMPTHFKGKDLAGARIANIESDDFAPTTHRLPDKDITLGPRKKFSRHSLHGLNVFMNQMFQQFPLILGVRQIDYMVKSAVTPSLITTQNSMLEMAARETAWVEITGVSRDRGRLQADVLVTNRTGHYLPSGVGFRRMFLELIVHDKDGNEIWASGKTNELGVILDCRWVASTKTQHCATLSTERSGVRSGEAQPHYQRITRTDQVQIYQELNADSDGILTTSFLRRVKEVKDNRLRAKGFDPAVFAGNPSPYIQALAKCEGEAVCNDPYYRDPNLTGADTISYAIDLDDDSLARVDRISIRLLSQSIPPFYLGDRFRDAEVGPAGKDDIGRLYYLTSHLNTGDPPGPNAPAFIRDWKLEVAGDCATADGDDCR